MAVNGTNVTVLLNGSDYFTYTFAPRVIDGWSYNINAGLIGVGSDNSRGYFDNITVQVLPPEITFDHTEDFTDGVANLFTGTTTGSWAVSADARYTGTPAAGEDLAVNAVDLGLGRGLAFASYLELRATLSTHGIGGLVFDQYAADDFKFVALDVVAGRVLIGHHTPKQGWEIDTWAAWPVVAGQDHTLLLTMLGAAVSVTLDGQAVTGWGFNSAIVDGGFGLLTRGASSSFDAVTIKTNDPAFADETTAMTVAGGVAGPGGPPLREAMLAVLVDEATRFWVARLGSDALLALGELRFAVADLAGGMLGQAHGTTIYLDVDAAGYGWFVEPGLVAGAESMTGLVDALAVVIHEMGHVLGLTHAELAEASAAILEPAITGEAAVGTAESRSAPVGAAHEVTGRASATANPRTAAVIRPPLSPLPAPQLGVVEWVGSGGIGMTPVLPASSPTGVPVWGLAVATLLLAVLLRRRRLLLSG